MEGTRAVLHDVIGHVTVQAVDAVFTVGAGRAEVLVAGVAGVAGRPGAGEADGADDEVAGVEVRDGGSGFENFREGFVPQDEMIGAGGRCTVNKGADFFIGAADADFDHTQFDVGGGGNRGFGAVR